MSGVYCNQCGHLNPSASRFCSSCGGVLEIVEREDNTITFHPVDSSAEIGDDELVVRLSGLPEGVAILVQRRGTEPGTQYVLASETTTVGRAPDSDIFLDDITVSRNHAEFVREDVGYRVIDKKSLNGTYVNREQTDSAHLNSGDEVQIGKFRLVFLWAEPKQL